MWLLCVGLPMVGVWRNLHVLLCLRVVRAAIACYMSCVVVCFLARGCLLWFVVVVLCCVLCVGCRCVLLGVVVVVLFIVVLCAVVVKC